MLLADYIKTWFETMQGQPYEILNIEYDKSTINKLITYNTKGNIGHFTIDYDTYLHYMQRYHNIDRIAASNVWNSKWSVKQTNAALLAVNDALKELI